GGGTYIHGWRPAWRSQAVALRAGDSSVVRAGATFLLQQRVVERKGRKLDGAARGDQHLFLELHPFATAALADVALDAQHHALVQHAVVGAVDIFAIHDE